MVFRQKHPIIFGFFILAGIFLLFTGGISLFVSLLVSRPGKADLFSRQPGVGVVELKGLIVDPEQTLKVLNAFRRNKGVKAIVLRIDSPGGAVGASQEIYREVKRIDEEKPVIASMGSVAASGGYYAALGARRIIANPGTITGSMGVIAKFVNLEELFQKIGYKNQVIKSGKLKDIGAADRPMTGEEKTLLQNLINSLHGQFVKAVVQSRALPEDKVRSLADGRIFSGEQALANGLIDQLGNFTDAVILAARLGGLDTETLELIYPREKLSWFDIFSSRSKEAFLNNFMPKQPVLSYEWPGLTTE